MKKVFVLDTNVLLHDPNSIDHFDDNEVVIPIHCIEEIDRFKGESSERGRNARAITRRLDYYRTNGKLADGIDNDVGGSIRVSLNKGAYPRLKGDDIETDDLILEVALKEREMASDDIPVIFVTNDINLRIRANAVGLETQDYTSDKVDISELYSGVATLDMLSSDIDKFYSEGALHYPKGLYPNQYVIMQNGKQSAIGMYQESSKSIVPLLSASNEVWGLRPRNKEQSFALDLLLRDDIKLVSLIGLAGSGKTVMAVAAGLQKVVEEQKYRKLLVSRPVFPMGKDLGFLPGEIDAKLRPWMQPIYDNLEFLMGGPPKKDEDETSYQYLMSMGAIEVEPLTYIRGRSIPNQFLIVDESQNLSPHEIKTIITRVGEGTKVILTGDPYQIDSPYMDATNNGLTSVVNKFQNYGLAGHITLVKGERSELATLAANIL